MKPAYPVNGRMLLSLDDRMFFVKTVKFTADIKSEMLPITFVVVEAKDFLDNPETNQIYKIQFIADANLCHDIIEFFMTCEKDDTFAIIAKNGLLNWRIAPGEELRKFFGDRTEEF